MKVWQKLGVKDIDVFVTIHHACDREQETKTISWEWPPKHFLFRVFDVLLDVCGCYRFTDGSPNELNTSLHFKMALIREGNLQHIISISNSQ